MKHLMTHKFIFGLLMAVVLALGVQGVAEAVTDPNLTQVTGTTAGQILHSYSIGETQTVGSGLNGLTGTRPGTVETVTISRTGGITFLTPFTSAGSITLRETETDGANGPLTPSSPTGLAAFATLNIGFTSAGRQTVTIRGTEYTEVPGSDPVRYTSENWSYTHIFHVMQPTTNRAATVTLDGQNVGYKTGVFTGSNIKIHNGSGSSAVTYTVSSGGSLDIAHRDSSTAADLPTGNVSSVFDLLLTTTGTAVVTAEVEGSDVTNRVTYIQGQPTLTVTSPDDNDGDGVSDSASTNPGSKSVPGAINALLTANGSDTNAALEATISDGAGTGVPGIVVRFQVRGGGDGGGWVVFDSDSTGTLVESNRRDKTIQSETGKTLYVRTDTTGEANVKFRLGTDRKQDVTVTAVGQSKMMSLYAAVPGAGKELVNPRSTLRAGKYDVRVNVEEDGQPFTTGETVRFTTNDGTLDDPSTTTLATRQALSVPSDGNGVAFVIFDPDEGSGPLTVTARIWDPGVDGTLGNVDDTIIAETVINVRGGSSQPPAQQPPAQQTRNITVTASPSPAAPGNTVTVIASLSDNASGIPVTFSTTTRGVIFSTPAPTTAGNTQSQFIVPSGVSSLTITAAAGNYLGGSITISVSGTPEPAEEPEVTVLGPASIEIYDGDDQQGEINRRLAEDLVVEVIDRNNRGVSFEIVNLRVVEGSGRFSPTRPRTDSNGRASFSFTPRSPGPQGTIEIEASVADLSPVTFTVNVGEPPDTIVRVSGNNQSGRPGQALANPFVVEVIDTNDDPVSRITVTFDVTAGGGSVSPASTTTDNNGRAQTTLTLGDDIGENTVVASVSGITDTVTFNARAGAEVLVDAERRPDMYWVSRTEGKLQRLVADDVEAIAPNITGITSLAIDTQNDLLYWTRQTGENRSAIQRAGLNGRGVVTLQTSLTLMNSIAVNATGTTFYWTDILGKIKSKPTQGNTVTLLRQNLSAPKGLVWANDYLYWGEATGHIRRMNLRNTSRQVETIVTGAGEPISLAVYNGRVYWTEISGNASKLKRVNTDGTDLAELKTLTGTRRVWLTVDGTDSKIYLTRLSKIERRSLSGQNTVNIVASLDSPGSLVLNGDLVRTTPVVSQPSQPRQPTNNAAISKYDINEDGAVNNADTRLVAADVGNSGDAIKTARADVDGSGTVDVTDLILVIANLDDTVAAPAIDIDVKSLDINFDLVQEQIEMLLASGDRSIAAQRALLYLQHLLANARPDETVLLANYPNPFNPETWIPYHLANSTDVKIRIYDAQGIVVRELTLGHQSAGYYTSRSRAAYWDGRNALGERVASGIYFYQLETDEMSPLRKMVILK